MRHIRKATANDADSIAELYREFLPNSGIDVLPQHIARMSDDLHTHLLVCEEADEILATVTINFCMNAMFGTQPIAFINNMIVSNHYQREGIGKSLVDHIEAFCNAQNCSKIVLLSSADNRQARDFLAAMGYDPDENIGFVKYKKYFNH